MLRLRRKRLVEDRIDLEVRITISTSTFPTTPTASTRLNIELATGNSTSTSYLLLVESVLHYYVMLSGPSRGLFWAF